MITEAQALERLLEWFADERHWAKKTLGEVDLEGNVLNTCLYGGMKMIYVGRINAAGPCNLFQLADRIGRVIEEQFPERDNGSKRYYVGPFNDHPETTIADVRSVLEKTLAQVQEEG